MPREPWTPPGTPSLSWRSLQRLVVSRHGARECRERSQATLLLADPLYCTVRILTAGDAPGRLESELTPKPANPRLVFQPLTVRGIELRNRVVITAHGASETFRHPAARPDAYIEYLRRRAVGGAGLIIVQPTFVRPGRRAFTPALVDRHTRLTSVLR